jgi:integrase
MRAHLTAALVHSAKTPEHGQLDIWDSKLPGFGLRVSEGWVKSWTVLYRHQGRCRRLTLGRYPILSLADAHHLARTALRDAALGLDPAGVKRGARSAETFGNLADIFIERYAKVMKRSWREDERKIRVELLPHWANRKAASITRKDVIALLDGIADRGSSIMANRVKALISKIFNFGIRRGIVELNPATGVENPGEEHSRDHVLSEDELRNLWLALDEEPFATAAIFRLALLTAQRRGEIVGLQWTELDLDAGWWLLPAERAKNGLAHRVPLCPEALATLRKLREAGEDPVFVFPGSKRGRPVAKLDNAVARLVRRVGADFRFHDLRRTVASHMTGIGISRLLVSKILNHVERGITAIYDRHSYDGEKRAALLKWERYLLEIVTNERACKVVALRG